MFLCICKGIRISDAVEAARSGNCSIETLVSSYGFDDDTSCGRCARYEQEIVTLIRIELNKPVFTPSSKRVEGATNGASNSHQLPPDKHRPWYHLRQMAKGS